MAINNIVTTAQRSNFRRIISRLDKVHTDAKILKVISLATDFLAAQDIGWDAVSLRTSTEYVPVSKRRALAKVANAVSPAMNGTMPLGADGRVLLKQAIVRHADWPVIKETLDVDIHHAPVADLIAIAQLLKLDERFVAMFAPPVTQAELPFNSKETGNPSE